MSLPAGRMQIVLLVFLSIFIGSVSQLAGEPQEVDSEQVSESQPADPSDSKFQEITLGKDARMSYFLIPPTELAENEKLRLLIFLPGGDGGRDYLPFVTRIAERAVPEGYVVVQMIAPRFSDMQAGSVVWPTSGLTLPEVEFTTEEFAAAVIKDVFERHEIDPRYVFALGWSSGGPAVYAMSLDKSLPMTGAFIAMSVFKESQLPDLSAAKGKAYYILHSPQDFIKMRFPEKAQEVLTKHGARVKLETFEGGHGWHGDVYGNIRRGINWLEISAHQEKE